MLITPDDEARVAQISETGAATSEEISWLCTLAQRLARIKPTEESFPTYAALVHTLQNYSFTLRFVDTVHLEEETRIRHGHPIPLELFTHTTESAVCDALLCVRPYIRLIEPHNEKMLYRLARQSLVRVSIDEELVFDGSAEEHLIGFDGYGLRRKPFQFRAAGALFPGANLEPRPPVPGLVAPTEGEGTAGTERGIFLPNNSNIKIWLAGIDIQADETLLLSTGLVAGHYTTRAPGSRSYRKSRKEWDPRN